MATTPTSSKADALLDAIAHEERLRKVAQDTHGSLEAFVREAWGTVEPSDLVWNTHLSLICGRLEAIESGDLKRLVICVPPGAGKSLLVSVFYPAWRWLRDPTRRLQFFSGSNSVRKRDSRRTRKVVKSILYADLQERLGREWHLAEDQNTKINFENSHGGFRQCMTIGGKITGDRADEQLCDDPYDVKEATKGDEGRIRERMVEVIQDWDNVLVNRLNDEANNPRVLIQQRLHPSDLAGELIERGWPHLVLPMEYEPDHPHVCDDDWRTEPGELLFPERYPRELIEQRKQSMLKGQWLAQYQQRPQPTGGAIIKDAWVEQRWHQLPTREGRWVQSWDLRAGGKSSTSSYAVGQLWFQPEVSPGEAYLVDQKRGRWDVTDTLAHMRAVQSQDLWGRATAKLVEEKADGRAVVPMLKGEVPGIIGTSPKGSKKARLETIAPYFRAGNVWLPAKDERPWVTEYVTELTTFPGAPNDDQVDATTQALDYLLVKSGGELSSIFDSSSTPRTGGSLANIFD